MEPAWAFVLLVVYPVLQLPLIWVIVRRFDLRNDDGPGDPVGYSLVDSGGGRTSQYEWDAGRCAHCGVRNDPIADYCTNCLSGL